MYIDGVPVWCAARCGEKNQNTLYKRDILPSWFNQIRSVEIAIEKLTLWQWFKSVFVAQQDVR